MSRRLRCIAKNKTGRRCRNAARPKTHRCVLHARCAATINGKQCRLTVGHEGPHETHDVGPFKGVVNWGMDHAASTFSAVVLK